MASQLAPDLDRWLPRPLVRVTHRRESDAPAPALWAAAGDVRLGDTRALGRLIRLRIPGLEAGTRFDDLFRSPPFNVLHDGTELLVSGLVGRIWTLRRDYPVLGSPDEFLGWSARGTVRVLFGLWAETDRDGRAALVSETRVDAVDRGARIGLATLRPLITGSQHLIGREGLDLAVRRAAGGGDPAPS